tara:strand:- start:367 stop:693 length:327 start_codon:yes stop_codon:yes gene_type:complete
MSWWPIKDRELRNKITKQDETKGKGKASICYNDPSEIVSVDKELIGNISKDELILKLSQELGPNVFNNWFRETFGEPPPYIYTKGSMGRFKSNRFKVNVNIIEGDIDG